MGAGIQVPPNSGKLLERWGVAQRFAKYVVQPAKMNFRRWQNGDLIGVTDTSPEFTAQYGAPYYVVHRAHLHNALYQQAAAIGVKTRLNSRVDTYDPETATIILSDGSVFQGDLVVAADGTWHHLLSISVWSYTATMVAITVAEFLKHSLNILSRREVARTCARLAQWTRSTEGYRICCVPCNSRREEDEAIPRACLDSREA